LSLQTELKKLFDDRTRKRAAKIKPTEVDALAVHDAAGALLRLKGQPGQQVSLVRAMPPSTAAALCRWLSDPAFWGLVCGVTKH